MAAAGKGAGRYSGGGCTAHAVAGVGAPGQKPANPSTEPFRDVIAWVLSLCPKPWQSFIACPGTPRGVLGLIWITAKTKMADQPLLLQISKLGRLQLLSGPSALAAFAGAPLPKNKAHPAGELTAAPTAESPPST